jgi:hypothetical protein
MVVGQREPSLSAKRGGCKQACASVLQPQCLVSQYAVTHHTPSSLALSLSNHTIHSPFLTLQSEESHHLCEQLEESHLCEHEYTSRNVEDLYSQLHELTHSKSHWKGELMFDEASETDTEARLINLCDYLTPGLHHPHYPKKTRYMFPQRFVGAKDALKVELKLASGVSLVVRDSKPARSQARLQEFTLECNKKSAYIARTYDEDHVDASAPATISSKKKKKQNKSTSGKNVVADELCGFSLIF